MNVSNPYHAPPVDEVQQPANPSRSVRLSVMATLLFLSLVTAHLVTPADPASSFLAAIPIFGLCTGAYYFGLKQRSRGA